MPEYYERRFRHQDGQTAWTHASATPIFDAEHHFNGSFAMFTDITERKRAEIRLNEQLHLLQQLLDSIPFPSIIRIRKDCISAAMRRSRHHRLAEKGHCGQHSARSGPEGAR